MNNWYRHLYNSYPIFKDKGRLQYIGMHNLGRDRYHYYRCKDCQTDYPVLDVDCGWPSCNGKIITDCSCVKETRTLTR